MSDARAKAVERLAESLFDRDAFGARWDNESDAVRAEYRVEAIRLLDALGLVAVPPEMVERVRAADAELARYKRDGCSDPDGDPAWDRKVYEEPRAQAVLNAREDLLDAVLAQLKRPNAPGLSASGR